MNLRLSRIALPAIILFCLVCCALAPAQQRGWWPQPYTVERNEAAGLLTLSTPYYTFEHNLKKGGVLARITLTHGKVKNLLVSPIESRVRPMIRPAGEQDPQTMRRGPGTVYSDLNDPAPKVTHSKSSKAEVVTVEAALLGQDGKKSGVRVRTIYSYRWGYVKVRKEFIVDSPTDIVSFTALTALLDPSLSDYGWRPAAMEENGNSPFNWTNGQIRGWGKMRPGTHMDLPFRTRFVPRYLVFANHGIEGLEWFVTDNLNQWDYQMTGQPGTAYCEIGASNEPLGVRINIEPMSLPWNPLLAKGGYQRLEGAYTFDYYLGVPILEGHAQKLWLHESVRGIRDRDGKEMTETGIRRLADSGIHEMTLHNDGDSFRDGIFWRDGSYPPYPPDVMKKMDAMIDTMHKHGIRISPYFSNHELHQSTEEFKKFGEEWGRKPDDQGNQRPNTFYGSHMCLKSGWLDFMKLCVDRVLKNHKFDGIYYDWNIAMFCNNPRHVGKTSNGVSGERGLAALALSETGHWDIDELLELVEWTRERVGPNGLFILHNTLVPMFATENFADKVVGLEFGYARLSVSVPPPSELPLEWDWAGARSRAAIIIGTLDNNAPKRIVRQHALLGLLTAVMPWRANEETIEFAARLRPLGNLEDYRFEDYRNSAVRLDGEKFVAALYSKQDEAYLLLGNFNAESKTVNCLVRPGNLPYPLSSVKSATVVSGAGAAVDVRKLTSSGAPVTIPADDLVILRLK